MQLPMPSASVVVHEVPPASVLIRVSLLSRTPATLPAPEPLSFQSSKDAPAMTVVVPDLTFLILSTAGEQLLTSTATGATKSLMAAVNESEDRLFRYALP